MRVVSVNASRDSAASPVERPAIVIDNLCMPKRSPDVSVIQRVDLLDVRLLDLFAQVEAMLRSAREIQRNAIKMRGISVPVSAAQRRTIADRIRKQVSTMERESVTLRTVVRSVVQASADVHAATRGNSDATRKGVG